ncbi:MAG: hypothetical protein QXI19_13670, partial [Candidatus Caldarchaeum sp.]
MPKNDRSTPEYALDELVDALLKYDRMSLIEPPSDLGELAHGEQHLYDSLPADIEGLLSKVRTHEEFALFLYALEKVFWEAKKCGYDLTIDQFLLCLSMLVEDEQIVTQYGVGDGLSWRAFGHLLLKTKESVLQNAGQLFLTEPLKTPEKDAWSLVGEVDSPKKVAQVLRAMVWNYYQRREHKEALWTIDQFLLCLSMLVEDEQIVPQYGVGDGLSWRAFGHLLLKT